MQQTLSVTELVKLTNVLEDNIMEIYEQATLKEYIEGKTWYERAKSFSFDIAKQYNVSPLISTGIVAALSPQKSWEQNMIITDLYFQGIHKHTKQQIEKCKRIEKAKSYVEISNILGGEKTRNFFGAIYSGGTSNHTVLDRHAIKVATHQTLHSCSDLQYKYIKSAYDNVGKKLGYNGCLVQSVTWIVWRSNKMTLRKEKIEK